MVWGQVVARGAGLVVKGVALCTIGAVAAGTVVRMTDSYMSAQEASVQELADLAGYTGPVVDPAVVAQRKELVEKTSVVPDALLDPQGTLDTISAELAVRWHDGVDNFAVWVASTADSAAQLTNKEIS
jgi:hypothetical protein